MWNPGQWQGGHVFFVTWYRTSAQAQHIHFPKYTSGTVTRAIDKQAQAYVKLAQAFEARNWDSVKEASKAKIFVEVCMRLRS